MKKLYCVVLGTFISVGAIAQTAFETQIEIAAIPVISEIASDKVGFSFTNYSQALPDECASNSFTYYVDFAPSFRLLKKSGNAGQPVNVVFKYGLTSVTVGSDGSTELRPFCAIATVLP